MDHENARHDADATTFTSSSFHIKQVQLPMSRM